MFTYFIENILPLFTLLYITKKEFNIIFKLSNFTPHYLYVNDTLLLTFCH